MRDSSLIDDDFSFRKIALPAFGPGMLYGVSNGAILPVVALSALDLGASQAEAGIISALIGVGSLISNIPSSLMTARYGEQRALVAASVVGVLSLLLALLASQVWMLGLGMLLNGMAASVFLLARQTFLIERVPLALRARAMSTLGGVNRIGVFIGPFIGAGLMHFMGLSGAYMIAIAAMTGAGLIAAYTMDLPARMAPSRASGGIAARSVLQVLGDQRRVVLTLGTAALLLCAMRASRQVVIPLWAEHLGLSPSLISIIFGLVAAVDMSVFYPAGKVMDTRGRLWVVLPSALLMAASFIAIPMTTGTMSFLLVALVLGFGNGIGAGAVMTLGADAAPQAIRMQFLGIWRVTNDIGSCAGPVLLSLLTATASLGVASFGTGLLGLAAAAAFWRWVPRRLE